MAAASEAGIGGVPAAFAHTHAPPGWMDMYSYWQGRELMCVLSPAYATYARRLIRR